MGQRKKPVSVTQLETERLVLKPISPFRFALQTLHWTTDRTALADLNMPPDGWTFRKWWKQLRKLNRRNRITHGIWVKGQDKPIGLHMVLLTELPGNANTGIFIGEKQWRGQGISVEAKRVVISELFERFGLYRVTSWVNARNFASIHMTLRLGFRQEAQMRKQAILLDGSCVDYLGFGLLRDEWEASKGSPKTRETD